MLTDLSQKGKQMKIIMNFLVLVALTNIIHYPVHFEQQKPGIYWFWEDDASDWDWEHIC